jgi:hypothetical protein
MLVVFCISLFAGCSTTGTKKPMNVGTLSGIHRLEVQVGVDKDFSVNVAGQEVNGIDFLLTAIALTGVPGKAVAAASESVAQELRARKDAQRAKDLRAAIAEIDLQNLAQEALVDGLQTSPRFTSVTAVTREGPPPAGAGVLRVRIENWGLYAGKSEARSLQKVQVGINATVSLFGADGKLSWERKDHPTGGVHRPIGEYGSSPALLRSEIEDTVKGYCARVVNDIRYAR